jgi:SOS-response transcriptional repressor LexA
MTEVHISEAELARRAEIPQPTLHRILSGATRSPRGTSLAPLANFFSVTINQLLGVDPLPQDRVPGTYNPRIQGWTPIPIIDWKQAGDWNKFKVKLRQSAWDEWVSTDLPVSEDAFAIEVRGTSMEPLFNEKTMLIIEPQREPVDRDFAVAIHKDHQKAVFKQILYDGDDRYLKSINEVFKTLELDKGYSIVGTLIQARMDFYKYGLKDEYDPILKRLEKSETSDSIIE